jgi:Zn ribbon nucleic-acid-binding protein
MATYHGIEHLECLQCGWQTRDDETMENINDGDGYCLECDNQFFLWSSVDGEQMVTSGGKQGGRADGDSLGWFRLRQAWGK